MTLTVADVVRELELLAPLHLADPNDNVGLLVGDPQAPCQQLLLSIDLTATVIEEAIGYGAQLLVSYHPPIYQPISRLRADSSGMDALVWQAIQAGLAIYSPHTALDAAAEGTNDVLARMCEGVDIRPLPATPASSSECKVVVFVPPLQVEAVAETMSSAGAGIIGAYQRCSFRLRGSGTFFGGAGSQPVIGQAGRLEEVEEIRLEMVAPQQRLSEVIAALRQAHPYEEPAYDIYPLQARPQPGIGRRARLPFTTTLRELAERLAAQIPHCTPQVVGTETMPISQIMVIAGAAGNIPFHQNLQAGEALITGELRHHEALTIQRRGAAAVALGHWASERPVLAPLAQRLFARLPNLEIRLSEADCAPLRPCS
ncbi:MAG: GTP cyclohydrolase 1 type 2 [Phycisphaerae bacterium]|nr:GTP cyclohydrolase 1 type 2 [Phycisphaerae bacterium]